MNASELFDAHRLQEAIDVQTQEVKKSPGDPAKRAFLFNLLVFSGDLERARRQLDAVSYDDVQRDLAVQTYRHLLDAEEARRRLFREGLAPGHLGEQPEHVRLRLQAVNRLRENSPAEALEALTRAAECSPAVRGQLNGKPFELLRDADDLFGTVLEVMAHGQYMWLPLEQVIRLTMKPPKYRHDLIWVPARLQARNGLSGDVFLPALYPGSHEHPDDQVKLGAITDWKQTDGGPTLALGLRTFVVDEDAVSLLEWRELGVEA
jgi:type VI secretion system protein ImpE